MQTLTIQIEEDEAVELVTEEVLSQIKKGNTSGVYPHWVIENINK